MTTANTSGPPPGNGDQPRSLARFPYPYQEWERALFEADRYWAAQEATIRRRIGYQLTNETRYDASFRALEAWYQQVVKEPYQGDPFDHYVGSLDDGTFLHDQELESDPDKLAAAYLGDERLEQREGDTKWTYATIKFYRTLCDLVARLTRAFIANNPDLLANAPELTRVWFMEWSVAPAIAEALKELFTQPDEPSIAGQETAPADR